VIRTLAARYPKTLLLTNWMSCVRRLGRLDRLLTQPQDEPPLPDAAVAGDRNCDVLAVPQQDSLFGRQRHAEEPVHPGGMAEVVEVDELRVVHFELEIQRVRRGRARTGETAHRSRA
jgi:hypothetical protein